MKWSTFYQNPEFLEFTRANMILPEFRPQILKWCGIDSKKSVLDVGCGTGFLIRWLMEEASEIKGYGIDSDDYFINYANDKAQSENKDIEFICGDALNLPFDDETFDVVISHTFFTCIADPIKAMEEMKRVCKSKGKICSITVMSHNSMSFHEGYYPTGCDWVDEYNRFFDKFDKILRSVSSPIIFNKGTEPTEIPRFFSSSGLKNISVYPVGTFFSLSNSTLSYEQKIAYIDMNYISEEKRIKAHLQLDEVKKQITQYEAERYLELLKIRRDFLKENINDNSIWDWYGSCNILVTGEN